MNRINPEDLRSTTDLAALQQRAIRGLLKGTLEHQFLQFPHTDLATLMTAGPDGQPLDTRFPVEWWKLVADRMPRDDSLGVEITDRGPGRSGVLVWLYLNLFAGGYFVMLAWPLAFTVNAQAEEFLRRLHALAKNYCTEGTLQNPEPCPRVEW